MKLEQLKKIIAEAINRESPELEFKKSMSLLKPAVCTVCAYLNDNGGKVLIGVTNDGTIVGNTVSDNTQQEIANELLKIEPAVKIKVDYVNLDNNKQVVILTAQ